MTRLLYIHNIAMPGPEANTVNVAKMCNAFAALGCDVTLAALPGTPAARLEAEVQAYYGVTEAFGVTPLPASSARPAFAALAALRLARRLKPDLVYTRIPHAALAMCVARIPTVLELHTDVSAFSAVGRWAALRVARHPSTTMIVAISAALERRLHERVPHAPIFVAHDGADARETTKSAEHERLRAGFVGRFYKGKGVELIVRLASLCPWADFEIVGGDEACARALAGGALPTNVHVHGPAPHADVAQFMDQCDVMLAPYQRVVMVADGRTDAAPWMSPLKIFEYMAAGKAVLASDLPVIREILAHGDTALLLPPDQPSLWAEALCRLRDDHDLRHRLGQGARRAFLGRHTWLQRARSILDACRERRAPDTRPAAEPLRPGRAV